MHQYYEIGLTDPAESHISYYFHYCINSHDANRAHIIAFSLSHYLTKGTVIGVAQCGYAVIIIIHLKELAVSLQAPKKVIISYSSSYIHC